MTDIQKELAEIKDRLDRIEKICTKMDRHISFIDRVYDSVEKPLSYIKNRVENFLKINNEKKLPIKDY